MGAIKRKPRKVTNDAARLEKLLNRRIEREQRRSLRDIKGHFKDKKGGWPLSLSVYVHLATVSILKRSVLAELRTALTAAGHTVEVRDGQWMITK